MGVGFSGVGSVGFSCSIKEARQESVPSGHCFARQRGVIPTSIIQSTRHDASKKLAK